MRFSEQQIRRKYMIIAEINTVNFGSTGNIMYGIQKKAISNGFTVYSYYCMGDKKENNTESFQVGSKLYNKITGKIAHLTGKIGCYSFLSTFLLINKFRKKNVDTIHLHNLHISFLNLPMLFRYIKKNHIKVIWTLHDCWAFTGHCPYFTIAKCDKWKKGCYECPQYKEYPASSFDNSKTMWRLKNKWFTDVENMTIVTPSKWLAGLVKESFLKDYPVKVIYNGIDLSIFKPTPSNFRKKYAISNDKFILLGVAFGWGKRKGLDVFIELAQRLNPTQYQIVLVGTNDIIDRQLPSSVLSIHKTANQVELAEIYTAANLFVNPTREEVLGMVNIEANACGIPVITFNSGGSPECINKNSGTVIECDDIDALEKEIIRIFEKRPFTKNDCIKRAKAFDLNDRFGDYVKLYGSSNIADI